MTYCFSPLLLSKISERFRLSRKKGVFFGVLGISVSQIIFYFSLEPIPFLISRVLEGFMAGLVWTNLQSTISDNAERNHSKYMAIYNFSWNLGTLLGFLAGTIMLFFIGDLLIIFYFSPFLLFINVFVILFFFEESVKIKNLNCEKETEKGKKGGIINQSKQDVQTLSRCYIPSIIPLLFMIAFSIVRVCVLFTYPLKSEILGFKAYTAYLLSFLCLITQTFSITFASYLPLKHLKKVSTICVLVSSAIVFLLGLNTNYVMFVILILVLGFFNGFLYSLGLKVFLYLNIQRETSKYSSICESSIGLTFLVAPIFAAFLTAAYDDINLSFYAFSVILFLILILNFIYFRKMKNSN